MTIRSGHAWIATIIIALVLLAAWAYSLVDGLSLVVRGANLQGTIRTLADLGTAPHVERLVRMQVGPHALAARVYSPVGESRQTLVLVAGLHPDGIDEPRLRAFATELARSHVTVVTPDIPELSRLEITPTLTDRIEQAALWVAAESELSPTGRVGLIGISFSGGLSIVAAGRPALRDRLSYVLAFGGHEDLPRVLEYLCTGIEGGPGRGELSDLDTTAMRVAPDSYGVAVVLLNVADDVVPAEQVATVRDAVRRFLEASILYGVDKPAAEREFAALRTLALRMPQPAAMLLQSVNDRDVTRLGPLLLPHLARHAAAPALSPSRSPAPTAPVFLLHGSHDTIIPAAESVYLAQRLRNQQVSVRLLLTDLVSHVDADQPAQAVDVWKLARFWGDVLAR